MRQLSRAAECVALIQEWLDAGEDVDIRARLRDLGYGNSSISTALKSYPHLISVGTGTKRNSRRWIEP